MNENKCNDCPKNQTLVSGWKCCMGNSCEIDVRADERAKVIGEVYERYNGDLGSFGFWLYEQMKELK